MFMLVRFGPKQNNEKVELMIFTHMKRWLCRRTTCDRKLFNIWHKTKVVDSFLEWHSVSWATWCEWLLFWPHFCPTAASKNRRPTFWRIKKKTGLEWRKLQTRLLSFHTQVCWLPYLSIYLSISLSLYLSLSLSLSLSLYLISLSLSLSI